MARPFGVPQRRFKGLGQALAKIFANLQPIDHDIDGVFLGFGELGDGVDVVDLSVYPQPGKSLRAQLGNQIELFALAIGDHRREDHQPTFLGQGEDVVDHLRNGLRLQRLLVFDAVRGACAREEQAQVVVDFGHRADGRARVVTGRLLLDRNRRRQPLDQIDVGFLDALQKLPGIGRQGFDVAALSLGV
jgi:hypothetical protein